MSLSYDFIALLAVLSASQVASINSVVIDAQGNAERHLKNRMIPKTENSVHVAIDAQGNSEGQSVMTPKEPQTTSSNKAEALLQTNEEEAVIMLQIDGMMCGKCAGNVERALSRVPGVRGASVSHITQKGQVHFHPSIVSKDTMIGAVKGIGFGASLFQEGEKPEALLQLDGVSDVEVAMLRIDGMMCEMCSARVESALSGLPGVRGASVSPTTRVGQVLFHPSLVSTDALVDAVKGVGFGASLLQEGDEPEALLQLNGEEAVVMLQIDGMMCDKCAANVERALSRVPGVHGARVSHTIHKGQGQVHFHPSVASTGAIVDAVKDLGFGASLLQVQGVHDLMRKEVVLGNATQTRALLNKRAGNAPIDGICANEGDICAGNHCVLLTGALLDDFQTQTQQNFADSGQHTVGNPAEWCVCLHLYRSWGKGGGDESLCSAAAKAAC